jgi:hypothetical protein
MIVANCSILISVCNSTYWSSDFHSFSLVAILIFPAQSLQSSSLFLWRHLRSPLSFYSRCSSAARYCDACDLLPAFTGLKLKSVTDVTDALQTLVVLKLFVARSFTGYSFIMSWLPLESNPDVRAQSFQFLMWFLCWNNFRHIIACFYFSLQVMNKVSFKNCGDVVAWKLGKICHSI